MPEMDKPDVDIQHEPSDPSPSAGVMHSQITDPEQVLWAEFAEATGFEAFCKSWLALQCGLIPGVTSGVVLLGPPDRGPYSPVAVWPYVRRSMSYLSTVAERALRERRGLVLRHEASEYTDSSSPARQELAYPIQVAGRLHGVIVLELTPCPESELQSASRQLHWGTAWLEVLFRREEASKDAATRERLQAAVDLLATTVTHQRFRAAATAFATDVATRLSCDRVTVGFMRKGHAQVMAMSHSAQFDKKTNLIRAIGAAMDEALDQAATVVYPAPLGGTTLVTRAHAELARQYGAGVIASIPLVENQQAIGALTLERPGDQPMDTQTLELCEAAASLAGPVLEVKRRDDRWLGAKAFAAWRAQLAALFGPRHLGLKLGVIGVVGLVAFLALFTSPFHVTAEAVTEGVIQRAAVAPFDGYVASAPLKAGDLVTEGQVLATLEDRELILERFRWVSQLEQVQKQYRQALADRDAAQTEIFSAQIAQATAQLALVEDRLARTQIRAPFNGVIVAGDLTQSLGAPVEQGQSLFELAPLNAYRIILQVDERDVTYVSLGQGGQLLLSAMPNDPLSLEITHITPVSTAEEGRNYFRVEARLTSTPERLRPGMEGVGKIEIEPRLFAWTVTRRAVDWLRLTLWRWMP